jgi:hypothetical protein
MKRNRVGEGERERKEERERLTLRKSHIYWFLPHLLSTHAKQAQISASRHKC